MELRMVVPQICTRPLIVVMVIVVSSCAYVTRASVSSNEAQANGRSERAVLSADGRFLAFASTATNLVDGDKNGQEDVFLRDLATGTTRRVCVVTDGTQSNGQSLDDAVSANGQFVGFSTTNSLVLFDTDGVDDVYVRNLLSTPAFTWISVANGSAQPDGASVSPALSSDGRYVAFESLASNLVPNDTNGWEDVFVRDRVGGTTARVSTASGGVQANFLSFGPHISDDG